MNYSFESSLSRPVRRAAAAGLLLATIAALWGAVVRPVWEWTDGRVESLQDARFELSRARALAVSDSGLTEANVTSAELSRLPLLLHGSGEAEAVAELQSIVERIARTEGLAIESMQAGPPMPQGATRAIVLELRAQATEHNFVRALAALEQSRPMVRVERLQLRADVSAVPLAGSPAALRLAVELRLASVWIPPDAASVAQEPQK